MIKVMTINDYEKLFALWEKTPNMGLRSLDDSKEGDIFIIPLFCLNTDVRE